MSDDIVIGAKFPPELLAKLDKLAEQSERNRSQELRWLVQQAPEPEEATDEPARATDRQSPD